MSGLRVSRVYCVFVGIGLSELAALLLVGEGQITPKGLIPLFALVLWLGFGSRAARWLLVLINAWVMVGTLALALGSSSGGSGADTLWGNVIVVLAGSTALLATLLSSAMRVHTGGHQRPPKAGLRRLSLSNRHLQP